MLGTTMQVDDRGDAGGAPTMVYARWNRPCQSCNGLVHQLRIRRAATTSFQQKGGTRATTVVLQRAAAKGTGCCPPRRSAHVWGAKAEMLAGTGRRGFLFVLTNAREGGDSAAGYKSPDQRKKSESGLSARSDGPGSLHRVAGIRPAQQLRFGFGAIEPVNRVCGPDSGPRSTV